MQKYLEKSWGGYICILILKTMKTIIRITNALIFVFAFVSLISCNKDNANDSVENDPIGTNLMYLSSDPDSAVYPNKWNGGGFIWGAPNNLLTFWANSCVGGFLDLGKKKGIGDINLKELPEADLFVSSIAVQEKHAYLAYMASDWGNTPRGYVAIYIIESTTNTRNEIIGAKIKWANYPFVN